MNLSCYITAKNQKEAEKIARHLLKKRLIGCANIFPSIKSYYWWRDDNKKSSEIVEDNESIIIGKTKSELKGQIIKEVKKVHSYSVPCVVFWEIKAGNKEYLGWLEGEINKNDKNKT